MMVMTPILEMIRGTQSEAIKEENRKRETVVGQVSAFDMDNRGLLTLHGRFSMPYTGGAR